jgi:hypothetical protein
MAQDLLAWARQLCLPAVFLEAARKRLRYQLLHVAGRLAHSSWRTTRRLDARWPWAAELAVAFTRLRSRPLTTSISGPVSMPSTDASTTAGTLPPH